MEAECLRNFDSISIAHQSRQRTVKFGEFGILNISLGSSDRRILSSAIESFLSKDEDLTLITTCFFRDVLLEDFPPETFIQESSLCQSLLQIVKESWEDPMLNYVTFQALMKLCNCLRRNIGFMDSSEFYQSRLPFSQSESIPFSSRSQDQDFLSGRSYSSFGSSRTASTDYFLSNLFQFLTGMSRALTYKPLNIHLWLLLESYSSLLQKYLTLFISDNPTTLHLSLEEVLLDISLCFLRNTDTVNPCLVASVMSSLLSNFDNKNNVILTKDIRKAIWGLASNTKLEHSAFSVVRNNFLHEAVQFEHDLLEALDLNANDLSSDSFRSDSWWKVDAIKEQRTLYEREESPFDGTGDKNIPSILNILFRIQNSVEHQQVFNGIDLLWENLFPFIFNTRNRNQNSTCDTQLISPKFPWRESFYRFFSVEPSTPTDETLLIRVLDITTVLLRTMKNSEEILEWVVPLVTVKNSSLLRLIHQESVQSLTSATTTNLSTLNRSAFDLYQAIIEEGSSSELIEEFFNLCTGILKLSHDAEFPSTAIVSTVLKSVAHLISVKPFVQKLKENIEVSLSLIEIVANGILVLCERTGKGSFRNRGAIHYGGIVLALLSDILVKDMTVSRVWIGYCVPIIPQLWSIESSIIKAIASQICVNITSNEEGTLALISQLESPTFLWRFAYTQLTDSEECSIVKQRAGIILLNLIKFWNQMRQVLGPQLEVPRLKLLEEIATLLVNVCWYSRISQSDSRNRNLRSEDTGSDEHSNDVPFVTPNVLSVCARMIIKLIQNTDLQQQLLPQSSSLIREICILLSRALGSYNVDKAVVEFGGDEVWRNETLISLVNTVQALTFIVELDTSLSLILIADRHNLSNLILYFTISPAQGTIKYKSSEILATLWRNIFVFLTTVIVNSKQNFEDLERLIWSQRKIIFPILLQWLDIRTPLTNRKSAIDFLNTLLRVSYKESPERSREFWCQVWIKPNQTYGMAICKQLLEFLDHSLDSDERSSILHGLNLLCLLSPTAKNCALQNQVVKKLVQSLRDLGVKAVDLQCNNRKNTKFQEQMKWLLTMLTTLFYNNQEAKVEARLTKFADAVHTIFKFIKSLPDRNLLHLMIDCLINFTAEFPEGSQSLTLTTGLVGVMSRKIATPNSQYVELLGILQSELESVDRNPAVNIKTIESLISFLKNTSFCIECRNIMVKGKTLHFLTRYHHIEIRKWGSKYPELKLVFLKTLVQLSGYPDIQLFLSRIPEAIGILITLSESEMPISLYALQILRNLSFHNGNRARLLYEVGFLRSLVARLHGSESPDELECVGVTIWAITANFEKGKVAAKRAGCAAALTNTIQRLQMKQYSSHSISPTLPTVISLLEKVVRVQRSNDGDGDTV